MSEEKPTKRARVVANLKGLGSLGVRGSGAVAGLAARGIVKGGKGVAGKIRERQAEKAAERAIIKEIEKEERIKLKAEGIKLRGSAARARVRKKFLAGPAWKRVLGAGRKAATKSIQAQRRKRR